MKLNRWIPLLLACCLCLWGCQPSTETASQAAAPSTPPAVERPEVTETATFAGGCFWCMEKPFDQIPGVFETISGYTGGALEDPSYGQVSSGQTGHAEAVQVVYDPKTVSYETLLDTFWTNVDPVDSGGQFCDRGSQYRTEIFYHSAAQKNAAEASKQALTESQTLNRPIVTPITQVTEFYPAEDYHQDYYLKNPLHYKAYRFSCGRDQRLAKVWGKEATN